MNCKLCTLVFALVLAQSATAAIAAEEGIVSYIEQQAAKLDTAKVPATKEAWQVMRDGWMRRLEAECFSNWPSKTEALSVKKEFDKSQNGIALRAISFTSHSSIRLKLYIAHYPGLETPDLIVLNVLDEEGWKEFLAAMRPGFESELKGEQLPPEDKKSYNEYRGMFRSFKWAMAFVAPTGVGPTAWNPKNRQKIHDELGSIGQTVDGMRVWDVRRASQVLRGAGDMSKVPLWMQSSGKMAGVALYASLFEKDVTRLDLHEMPISHRNGPHFIGVRRILDIPQAVAMAAEKSRVVIYKKPEDSWSYPAAVAKKLGWEGKLQLRKALKEEAK